MQLLRQRNVYTEVLVLVLVLPDDLHDSLMYSRWIELLNRMDQFLTKVWSEARVH